MSAGASHNELASTNTASLGADAQDRLNLVVDTVREMSRQNDPQEMVSLFRRRALQLYRGDGSISLSRRGLSAPQFRVTRSTNWKEHVNPWKERDRLPLLSGGLLADLLYGDSPVVLNGLRLGPDDPGYEYLKDARSLVALPLYDEGVGLNMVVRWASDQSRFDELDVADALLQANLFGRATHHLLTAQKLRAALAELEHEMKRIAGIQRSLLPARLPDIPTLDLAASYKTAARAGGDYYDFFDLGDGRWGVLIADVSGHGAAAAVVMAMLRTMLHSLCAERSSPSSVLSEVNRRLCEPAGSFDGTFVTAFFGVYDPGDRSLRYASAGHNPPLHVTRKRQVRELDGAQALPLGVAVGTTYTEGTATFQSGDTLLLYTDGITEAANDAGEAYGRERLLSCVREDVPNAQHIIDCVVHKLLAFTRGGVQFDDQTLLALRVS